MISFKSKKIKIIAFVLGVLIFICVLIPFIINGYVVNTANKYIITSDEAQNLDADCVLVLGAGVKPDGKMSDMLHDRMTLGIELYKSGAGRKILASGDHGRENYDEVNTMKMFAVENEVPAEDVFLDHAGFSTYESMYRARDIFKCKRIVIVTQGYHLKRAVYNARALGLDAYGVPSDPRSYGKKIHNSVREFLARNKDFIYCKFKPEPTFLGDEVPIYGDAKISDDRVY